MSISVGLATDSKHVSLNTDSEDGDHAERVTAFEVGGGDDDMDGDRVKWIDRLDAGSTIPFAVFNLVNSIIGAGIIGLPYAIRDCGLIMGTFLLLFVSWVTFYSVGLLIESGEEWKVYDYPSLAEKVFGKYGRRMATFFVFTMAFGAMIAYMMIVGDSITRVAEGGANGNRDSLFADRRFVIVLTSLVTILPVSLFRKMSSLASTSLFSISCDFALIVCVLAFSQQAAENSYVYAPGDSVPTRGITADLDAHAFSFARARVFQGIGAMSFAFVCHHSSFVVYNSMKNRTEEAWRKVSGAGGLIACAACMILGLGGYLRFYSWSKADVLNNFGFSVEISFARILLSFTMILTYPMEMFVAREILHAAIYGSSTPITPQRHLLFTMLLFLLSLFFACATDDLGFVLEFSGAVSSGVVGFILPPLFALYSPSWPSRSRATKILIRVVFVFGIVTSIVGAVSAILNSFGDLKDCTSKPSVHPPMTLVNGTNVPSISGDPVDGVQSIFFSRCP